LNSHLFDFTQGWIYVWGVGVLGGMMLRAGAVAPASGNDERDAAERPAGTLPALKMDGDPGTWDASRPLPGQ
jgi:hypothetical protein